MVAQVILSAMLFVIILYAWSQHRRSRAVALAGVLAAVGGLYFVWIPAHATALAELVGIGRGVDLIIYVWIMIGLLIALNLHLKLRSQMELITQLGREIALLKKSRSPDHDLKC